MLFTGRLTAQAEVATTKGDKKVTNFTVALNQRYKTKAGEKREKTAFVDCAYWINPGLADYLTKGAVVEVSGWMEAEAWTDREGNVHPRLVCNVDTIKLFSTTAKAETAETAETTKAANTAADDDDLPF
ncbi:single-stranded DNA-binding protein [Mucilaginibacter robiniae]|uniref:Single-stranded DNA-binding protein n=1 Tax=Mucilaginibacter robiniae TaxID=2728022 RepID=A0A7L5E161_9SPHI|nr:single-stranded DNA-binding protein [Mucilaginibacter robiniae]QJD96029.1 single-stranded DNA-binding protein [Mucilaginibacter robiniae]